MPLVAGEAVDEAGFFGRLWLGFKQLVRHGVSAMQGRFISLEGGEGTGKSTQLTALADALAGRGIHCLTTREPGGSPGAEAIRELLLGGADERWGPEAEALLFAAARADHVDKTIRPALQAGRWVLSDRFLDSSLAYQGGAGGLGIEAVRESTASESVTSCPIERLCCCSATRREGHVPATATSTTATASGRAPPNITARSKQLSASSLKQTPGACG